MSDNHILLLQKLRHLLTPSPDWGPALVQHRQLINYVPGFSVNPNEGSHSFGYENMSNPSRAEVVGAMVCNV